jgi:hypothetical protein
MGHRSIQNGQKPDDYRITIDQHNADIRDVKETGERTRNSGSTALNCSLPMEGTGGALGGAGG